MRVRLTLSALAAVALFALAACGTSSRPAGTLDFTGRTLDGKTFNAASLQGRPVVLWFWAPWCATCAQEADTLSKVAPRYKGKVDVIGVAGMGEEDEMHKFVSDYKLTGFPQIADGAGDIWKRFGITEQSVYVLIDRSGRVTHQDWIDYQDFGTVFDGLAKA
jgi:peroxiredoxin